MATKKIGNVKITAEILYPPDFKYSQNGNGYFTMKVKNSADGNEFYCKAFKEHAEKLYGEKYKEYDLVIIEGVHQLNDWKTRDKDPTSEGEDEIIINSVQRWETNGTDVEQFIVMAEKSLEVLGARMDKGLELMNAESKGSPKLIEYGMKYQALWNIHNRLNLCHHLLTNQCRPMDYEAGKVILVYGDENERKQKE